MTAEKELSENRKLLSDTLMPLEAFIIARLKGRTAIKFVMNSRTYNQKDFALRKYLLRVAV